jgi:hypothetical protein
VEHVRAEEPSRPSSSRRRRKPLRALRVALAGAMLIACGHLLLSAASNSESELGARARTPRRLIEAPAEALKAVSPRTVAAVMPVLQSIPVPGLSSGTSPASAPAVTAPEPAPADSAPEPIRFDSLAARVASPEIQAAPDAAEINATVPGRTESLAPQLVDSSGKKALKKLLRTIEGKPVTEANSPKR